MEHLGGGDKGDMERQRFEAELYAPLPEREVRRPAGGNDTGVESLTQFMVG